MWRMKMYEFVAAKLAISLQYQLLYSLNLIYHRTVKKIHTRIFY